MQNHVKWEILEHLERWSRQYDQRQLSGCTTAATAQKLSISRSLASHYLNELVEEKKLIKIASRPVVFLHRGVLENRYHVSITKSDFLNLDEFNAFLLSSTDGQSSFKRLVGYNGSLRSIINQSVSALAYPPSGLPMIVYGELGSGKSEFVKTLFAYGVDHNIYDVDSVLLTLSLDGESDKYEALQKRLDQQQAKGILCIQHAQHLRREMGDLLIRTLHEARQEESNGLLFILCMEEEPSLIFDIEFLQLFPMLLHFPSIEERGMDEKEELLMRYFKKEQQRMGKKVSISSSAFRSLCGYHYPHNRLDMQRMVMLACVNASKRKGAAVSVQIKDLPESILMSSKVSLRSNEERLMLAVDDFGEAPQKDRIIQVFEDIFTCYDKLAASGDLRAFLDHSFQLVKEYYDTLIFRQQYSDPRTRMIEFKITQILEEIDRQFKVCLPVHCVFVLARVISLFAYSNLAIRTWEKLHHQQFESCIQRICLQFPNEEFICEKIRDLIEANLGLPFNRADMLLLLICLSHYEQNGLKRHYLGIIVSHGYATASSICDAVNTMIGEYVFDAIDMPLDTDNNEVVKKLEQYLYKFGTGQGAVILVDMGSLEQIGEHLSHFTKGEIGILNNVNTRMALWIGYDILANKPLKDIIQQAASKQELSYTYLEARKRPKAAIFTSESGEYTAKQLLQLFEKSLPVSLDVQFLTADFMELQKYGRQCMPFQQYDVIFLAGTMNPKVEHTTFIAVEEVIAGSSQAIQEVMAAYLSPEEIARLNHQLMVNFSLQNVMEHITILNPARLMDQVVEAIDDLERRFHLQLDGKAKIGLYLHVSCLIERLVTKCAASPTMDLTLFQTEQQSFIEGVTGCFTDIARHYHVELPLSEILYLYEYIAGDKEEIKRYCGE